MGNALGKNKCFLQLKLFFTDFSPSILISCEFMPAATLNSTFAVLKFHCEYSTKYVLTHRTALQMGLLFLKETMPNSALERLLEQQILIFISAEFRSSSPKMQPDLLRSGDKVTLHKSPVFKLYRVRVLQLLHKDYCKRCTSTVWDCWNCQGNLSFILCIVWIKEKSFCSLCSWKAKVTLGRIKSLFSFLFTSTPSRLPPLSDKVKHSLPM